MLTGNGGMMIHLTSFNIDLGDWGREGAWRLRNALWWSPPVIRWSRSWSRLLQTLPSDLRLAAEALARRYDLSGWGRVCDAQGFRESLYTLDLLDRYVGPSTHSAPSLDIGCKNGCYLPGLQAWSGGSWDGVELDAHRRYWSLATRRAHGEFIARSLPASCRYLAGDVRDLHTPYGMITWFLPFLDEAPLRAWGLPRRFLRPLALLEHAWALLAPGGRLLIINQGDSEAKQQEQLFEQARIAARSLGRVDSPLSPFQRPRFGWLVARPGAATDPCATSPAANLTAAPLRPAPPSSRIQSCTR